MLQAAILGAEPGFGMIAAVALVDLVRYSLYILVFAVIVQAVLSWVNPYTLLAPALDTRRACSSGRCAATCRRWATWTSRRSSFCDPVRGRL